ncbi:type IV pilin N-terminal domain-containing protein [Halorubellus sp. PRR65]|uniref:type IV pilin N-terminal domain-containing protein n=1 Tax=Halorubellus sp. PRR65 TaxID=3098148 RepID=UPI002B25EC4F|nr:type IV pilin N-terminal domain-containing protein [Halorubellus sp. PRR65]
MVTRSERGVSSVVAAVLMVAVTVIMAAAVGSFALEFSGVEQQPAPQVANADAKFLVTGGGTDQTVRITHRGGDTVDVADLEIVVSFSDSPKRSRLVGIPTKKVGAGDYEGDNIWDGRAGIGVAGALSRSDPAGSDGEWSAGEYIQFRTKSGAVDVKSGEHVYVTVVHEPSGKVLLERSLRATTNALEPRSAASSLVSPAAVPAAWVVQARG